ncbi:MAG: hypothetical protein ACREEP_11375 [Dongiaceae bacterium]
MTGPELDAWIRLHFSSVRACARGLGIDKETLGAYIRGHTRHYQRPAPVPTYVALACAAWAMGLKDYDGVRPVPWLGTPREDQP